MADAGRSAAPWRPAANDSSVIMKNLPPSLAAVSILALASASLPDAGAAGVAVGNSALIGQLDYSDTFTGTDAGGAPNRPYQAAVQPPEAYVVESVYGNPTVSFEIGAGFSFAGDDMNRALVDGVPAYPFGIAPNASGAGSDTGITQTGGGVDYGLPYGLRDHYVVQVDAVQVGDRIDISSGDTVGIFATNSLSVFFRGDGSGNASLFNGTLDTPIQSIIPTFNTGISGAGDWHNYAVRYDIPGREIELYVDEVSVGLIDLTTFAGGTYQNFSNATVGAGAGLAAGENRTWTDNFQVGSPIPEPAAAMLALLGFAGLAARRRR